MGYVKHRAPLDKKRSVNKYTDAGRAEIHKKLEAINMDTLYQIMQNPVRQRSIEYNDNRLSLYCAQQGKCAITKRILKTGNMHCHHKIPIKNGGKDNYGNLILLLEEVHILVHATDVNVIEHYMCFLN